MDSEKKTAIKNAVFTFCKAVAPYVATLALSILGTCFGVPNSSVVALATGSAILGVTNV